MYVVEHLSTSVRFRSDLARLGIGSTGRPASNLGATSQDRNMVGDASRAIGRSQGHLVRNLFCFIMVCRESYDLSCYYNIPGDV